MQIFLRQIQTNLFTCADSDLINIDLRENFNVDISKLDPDIYNSLEAEISEKEVLVVFNEYEK